MVLRLWRGVDYGVPRGSHEPICRNFQCGSDEVSGKPVVATRSGGTIEQIRESSNGLLYAPGDYSELADKMIYLIQNPSAASRIAEAGRMWATEMFTQDRYAHDVLAVLDLVVARSNRGTVRNPSHEDTSTDRGKD